jgi:hypothetical protein
MTNKSATELAAEFLKNKLAAEELNIPPVAPSPAAASPELPQEALEENIGVEGGAQGGDEVEQLLASLSPEELEQLASELAGDIQGGQSASEDGEIGELAQAIATHLGTQPQEEAVKSAELDFVKSAGYIEGFLERAVEHGASFKQAVDLYEQALNETVNFVKQAAELKGDQHKLDLNNNGKIDSSDLKKLRGDKDATSEIDEKTAAYYEGVLERAREYGFSDAEILEFVKSSALSLPAPTLAGRFGAATSSAGKTVSSKYNKAKDFAEGFVKGNKADKVRGGESFTKGKDTAAFLRRNKKAIGLGAAAAGGAAAGGTVAYNLAKGKTEDNKEKQEEK